MASLLPLRVFIYPIYPPRLFTDGVESGVKLNCQNTRGFTSATPEIEPSRIQLTLGLNRADLIGAGQNLSRMQTPGDRCFWLVKSCSWQKAAK
jgi:hypothetical protein